MPDLSQEERRTAPMAELEKNCIERICREGLGQELHNFYIGPQPLEPTVANTLDVNALQNDRRLVTDWRSLIPFNFGIFQLGFDLN